MSMDDQGSWLTLTEAARRSGHTREALRQRVRRGRLHAQRGNDGQLRVREDDLADLPPPSGDDQEQPGAATAGLTLDILRVAVDDLRSTMNDLRQDLERTRSTLDAAQADRLADRGRAERAEARADAAETRLAAAEAALAESRTPWPARLILALRRRSR